MNRDPRDAWRPISLYSEGLQPRTGRHWNCVPAWDVTALCREPDGDFTHKGRKGFVFWDRHIDRRFHIDYPHATRESPRGVGRTLGDPAREWDTLIEHRDRYLCEAGLTPRSPPEQVARCLADSFRAESFAKKPLCPTFPENPRDLCHGIEGLLFKSWCNGCAYAYVNLADSCGFPVRAIGCGGHIVAEVFVGGRWRMVDSAGRHPENAGWPIYFESSYMEMVLDPMGDHGGPVPDGLRQGLAKRPNGQYHFHEGMWQAPPTLRFAAGNAHAIYPEAKRWGFKTLDPKRLPILHNRGGFYWPVVHTSDAAAVRALRHASFPGPICGEGPSRDYLYHAFPPGEKLRQSIYLDDLEGIEAIEVRLAFAPSMPSDFSPERGRELFVRVGDSRQSLAQRGGWPPAPDECGNVISTLRLPPDLFRARSVNWIELDNASTGLYHVPCVPEVRQPYLPPWWSETAPKT